MIGRRFGKVPTLLLILWLWPTLLWAASTGSEKPAPSAFWPIGIIPTTVATPPGASDAEASKVLSNLVDRLFALSKCPDYVVNRGHYFGTSYFKEEPGLSDDDKRALIEFLKTF